ELEDREVRVGLDRVADQRGGGELARAGERVPELAVVLEDRPPGVDVHGRAVLLGDVLDGDVFDAKLAAEIAEVIHKEIRRESFLATRRPKPFRSPSSPIPKSDGL